MRDYVQDMASGRVLRGYVSGMPLKPHLPALIDDIEFPEYREIGSTSSPRIWLGTRVIGPLHYDPSSNLHGIVYGGKRFTLFHPSQLSLLYPCSMFSVIPQMSQASLSNPDYARFPRLKKAKPVIVDLGIGTLACVALSSEERRIGLLYVDGRATGGTFTDLDVEILEALAGNVSVVLASLRIEREIREMLGVGGAPPVEDSAFLTELERRVLELARKDRRGAAAAASTRA